MLPALELAGLSISSYFVFLSVGWCVGGAIFYRAARREGMSAESALSIMAGCALGATLGATLMSALFVPWHELSARLAEGSAFIGRTVIGGIAGGIVGVEVCKKLIGHARSTGDAFALAIPPGHAIGRIGCLLQGCCYGTPTSLPWGVHYPSLSFAHASHVARGLVPSTAAASLPVHPAPLYEFAFDLGMWCLLLVARPRLRAQGSLFRLYLTCYAAFRFLAEFFRGDSLAPSGFFLKPVQVLLLLAMFAYGLRLRASERAATARASAAGLKKVETPDELCDPT
jgi:phosphatidylglycerol:prolipoprotein diacylglycerol transferase